MKRIGLVFVLLALAGCGGGGDDSASGLPTGGDQLVSAASIRCADLYNDEAGNSCAQQTASLLDNIIGLFAPKPAYAAVTPKIYNAGTLTRYKENGDLNQIYIHLEVVNSTPDLFMGYFDLVFGMGCNGENTVVAPKQPLQIEPGETYTNTMGAACSAMPTGPNTLASTIYGPDSQAIADQAIVTFALVE